MPTFADWNNPKFLEETNLRAKMGAAACRTAIEQSQAREPFRKLYFLGGNDLKWLEREFKYLERDFGPEILKPAQGLSAGTFAEKIVFISGENISELPVHYIVRKGDEAFAKNFAEYASIVNDDSWFAQDNARRNDDGTISARMTELGLKSNVCFVAYNEEQAPIFLFTDKIVFKAAKQHLGIKPITVAPEARTLDC
ncbi:MAG: hypothetical protein K2X63_07615 [Burkholderiaceae bacterium]|nr:hypothetical protein [Burkholderiaceae bacterium]